MFEQTIDHGGSSEGNVYCKSARHRNTANHVKPPAITKKNKSIKVNRRRV